MKPNDSMRRRVECTALPRGWVREEVLRTGGLSAGKFDVYYYPPGGKVKCRSKPEMVKFLGDSVDLSNFDYVAGVFTSSIIKPRGNKPKQTLGGSKVEPVKGGRNSNINSLIPPIRQTASIFKQPVTLVKVTESKVKNDVAKQNSSKEKPRQLFWEKRLDGIAAKSVNDQDILPMNLPESIKSLAVVEDSSTNTLLASISTALHLGTSPVIGQASKTDQLQKNPTAFVNPEQPLIDKLEVREDDISAQEVRVKEARNKLAAAIKALG